MITLNWSYPIIGPLTWAFMMKSTIILLGTWLVSLVNYNIRHPENPRGEILWNLTVIFSASLFSDYWGARTKV